MTHLLLTIQRRISRSSASRARGRIGSTHEPVVCLSRLASTGALEGLWVQLWSTELHTACAGECHLRAGADHRPLFLGERREQVEDERASRSATLGKQEWIISGGAMTILGQ